MPGLFEWKPDYSVSISRFDAEHKKLLSLADNLHHAMRDGRGRLVLEAMLKELVSYTRTHFAGEEELLARNGYPDLEQHRREHQALLKRVDDFVKDFEAGHLQISIELMDFLQNWITNHILNTDKNYSDYLNAAGVY